MKKLIITTVLAAIVAAGSTIMAQERPDEYLGLPGDNLNLYAVMDLFQHSETIEGFERSLNEENSRINNLDLNGDGQVDYLKVNDYVDGNVHTIVLQALLGRNESQDVAVFTVQRFRDGSVQIQLTGDEALYGKNYIIEPIMDETPNPGYVGNAGTVVRTTTVQIAAWPLVRFIYMPNYVVWHSSWYWGYYPTYWHPWRPFFWHYYYGYYHHMYPDYYRHYRHWDVHRYSHWNDYYYVGKRVYSPNVAMRIKAGDYHTTYSHPEQRREGEAYFAKVHPDRASSISSGNNSVRRSSSGTGRGNYNPSMNNGRRSSTDVSTNRGSNTSTVRSQGTTRRSSETVKSNPAVKPESGNGAGTYRRTSTTVTERKMSNPSAGQNQGVSRRSTVTSTERVVSKPESGRKIETVRTTRQSTTNVSSSNRRSNAGKAESVSKKNSSSEKDKSNSSRRK